jgi:SAM-dependent methyltransferase
MPSPLTRALFSSGRALERLSQLSFRLSAVTSSRADLNRATEREWHEFAVHRPASVELQAWERDFYKRHLFRGERALLIGCGSGRDLVGIANLGLQVDGVDPVAQATRMAQKLAAEHRLEARIDVARIEDYVVPGRYDAFVFSWFCYALIPESHTRVAVLRGLADHLNPGGRVLLSHVYNPNRPSRRAFALLRRVQQVFVSDWQLEYGDLIDYGGQYAHAFALDEVLDEAARAGLSARRSDPVPGGGHARVVTWVLEKL